MVSEEITSINPISGLYQHIKEMGCSSGSGSGRNPDANIAHDLGPYGATVRCGKTPNWLPAATRRGSAVNRAEPFKATEVGEIPESWEVTRWRSLSQKG